MDSADFTSWSMILGAAAGRPVERDLFSRRYGAVIRAYLAARWRVAQDSPGVADATNDVFVDCFKDGGALSRVDPTFAGGFRAFLYGVVRNVALMAERRLARQRDAAGGFAVENLVDSEASLSRVFDRAWAEAVVQEARDKMGARASRSAVAARRFRALAMRFEQGMPPREIAVALEEPVERIYEALREARVEFKASLMEVMAGYHPAASEADLERHCVELLAALR